MYKRSSKPRYDEILEDKTKLNEDGDETTQMSILNSLVDQAIDSKRGEFVIYDRTVLDNLAYTLWLFYNDKVSFEFADKTVSIVKNTLVFYDILFFMPISKTSPIIFKPTKNGSKDVQYREEIDNIFKSLVVRYNNNDAAFFPFDTKEGCPAIIEIFGDRKTRIELAKMYIGDDGECIKDDGNLFSFNDPNITDFI